MRKWTVLLLLWGIAWPAIAEKTLSIDQMEQMLIKLHGKPDGKVADELETIGLTERVSPARLERWEEEFPGKRTREELTKLADLSAFLNPPASDVLRDPPPDMETQERMVALAVDYVRLTTTRLPDFYATRETTHFEDVLSHRTDYAYSPSQSMDAHGGMTVPVATPGMSTTTEYRGLHSTGEFSMTVTYRDGHEALNEDAEKRRKEEESTLGLTSSGEFGPILRQVINDVTHLGVAFVRWEPGIGEPAAVFRYAVPASDSHFGVGVTTGGKTEEILSAYRGEIEIDPATGEILRFSEMAIPAPEHAGMKAAIVVDYAPVKIGDQSYICPVKGVAFSMVPVFSAGARDASDLPIQTNLNDIAFTHYHEFGSQARIVSNASVGDKNGAENGGEAPSANSSETSSTSGAPAAPATTANPTEAAENASNAAPPVAAPASATAPAAEEAAATPAETPGLSAAPSAARVGSGAVNPGGGAAETSTAPAASAANVPPVGPVFHAQSRLVVVDVSVSEHDKPVEGLERGQFHVFESGHEVPIASFEENEPPPSVKIAEAPVLPPDTYSNVPVYPEASAVNVLLLDALNTPTGDQEQARKQMIAYISTIKPGTALAIFTLSSRLRMVTGFTTDMAKLRQALEDKKLNQRSSADVGANASETMSSTLDQAASGIATSNDPGTRWLVGQITQFAADTQAYETDQRVMMTLNALSELARYLAAVPGKKNLIWFSGSFPISLSPDAMLSTQMKDVKDYSDDVMRTSALLSAARISVYPVDARGLMMSQTVSADYNPSMPMIQSAPGTINRDNSQFSEQNSQEQNTLSTIAAETGGRAFVNGNGLKETVAKIVADGSSYYSVSYVPPEEAGGKHPDEFRKVEVKVDGGKYQLSYRRGYFTGQGDETPSSSGTVPADVTSAAVLGAPPATQILFQAKILPEGDPGIAGPLPDKNPKDNPTSAFKGAPHPYVVDLGVPPGELDFTQGAGGARTAQLAIALVAYNREGQAVNSLGQQFALSLTAAQYGGLAASGKGIPVRVMLDLPAGANVVRAVVYDPSTAKVGSLEVPVAVQDAGANTSSK
jgi:VWFA-related protein